MQEDTSITFHYLFKNFSILRFHISWSCDLVFYCINIISAILINELNWIGFIVPSTHFRSFRDSQDWRFCFKVSFTMKKIWDPDTKPSHLLEDRVTDFDKWKKKVSVNEGNQKSLTKFTRWPSFGSNCPNFTIYVTGQWIDATDEIQSKSPDWFMKVTITFPLVTKLFTRKWSFKQLFFL